MEVWVDRSVDSRDMTAEKLSAYLVPACDTSDKEQSRIAYPLFLAIFSSLSSFPLHRAFIKSRMSVYSQ